MTENTSIRRRYEKSFTERPGFTEDEIEEIREAFNLLDTDGTGYKYYLSIYEII